MKNKRQVSLPFGTLAIGDSHSGFKLHMMMNKKTSMNFFLIKKIVQEGYHDFFILWMTIWMDIINVFRRN